MNNLGVGCCSMNLFSLFMELECTPTPSYNPLGEYNTMAFLL